MSNPIDLATTPEFAIEEARRQPENNTIGDLVDAVAARLTQGPDGHVAVGSLAEIVIATMEELQARNFLALIDENDGTVTYPSQEEQP